MNNPFPIATPPWSSLGKKIESMVRKALYEYSMLPEKGKLAIAVSGGKDSLTLLFFLKAIMGKGVPNLTLHPIYVDGEFSCGPSITKNFLQSICDKLELPLLIKESKQKRENLQCYSCSRTRRSLLFEGAKEIGATTIAMGHHREDSLQTLLMNLCHKAEFEEMAPKITMHDYDITIIRPLIYLSEKEIIRFAEKHHFKRISCQCPVGQDSHRKKTEELLNEMEKIFPNVRNNLFQAGKRYSTQKALRK